MLSCIWGGRSRRMEDKWDQSVQTLDLVEATHCPSNSLMRYFKQILGAAKVSVITEFLTIPCPLSKHFSAAESAPWNIAATGSFRLCCCWCSNIKAEALGATDSKARRTSRWMFSSSVEPIFQWEGRVFENVFPDNHHFALASLWISKSTFWGFWQPLLSFVPSKSLNEYQIWYGSLLMLFGDAKTQANKVYFAWGKWNLLMSSVIIFTPFTRLICLWPCLFIFNP